MAQRPLNSCLVLNIQIFKTKVASYLAAVARQEGRKVGRYSYCFHLEVIAGGNFSMRRVIGSALTALRCETCHAAAAAAIIFARKPHFDQFLTGKTKGCFDQFVFVYLWWWPTLVRKLEFGVLVWQTKYRKLHKNIRVYIIDCDRLFYKDEEVFIV